MIDKQIIGNRSDLQSNLDFYTVLTTSMVVMELGNHATGAVGRSRAINSNDTIIAPPHREKL